MRSVFPGLVVQVALDEGGKTVGFQIFTAVFCFVFSSWHGLLGGFLCLRRRELAYVRVFSAFAERVLPIGVYVLYS